MKGLLLKEFYSLIGLRNGLFILLVIVAFSGWNEMSDFVYTYIPMVLMMLAISSFSYDEYYHWDSYALTMPLDRKTLVQGKYVFVLLLFLHRF